MEGSLDALFRPKSVALVGASANPAKLSNVALRNLKKGSFKVYPVNPHESKILGLRCYGSVLDIPEPVDLALISLPAQSSLEPAAECVQMGVKVIAVTASGFRESGDSGAKLEKALMSIIRGSRTRLLGPNTMGVFVPSKRLDSFFIPAERMMRPGPGHLSIVSQSGAVSVSFLEKAAAAGIGVESCVGLGNKSDINENDVLRYLAADRESKCIALYLESFSDGKEFARVAGATTRRKPVVLLKSGRTGTGSRAARSHTGALASSSDAMVSGILKQLGVIRVYDEEELIDVAKALAYVDHIEGDKICVVASAGGFGVIGADLVESSDHGASLTMAELSNRTVNKLREIVPSYSSVSNPVDLTAGVTDDMYDATLAALQRDPGVDGIMMSLELHPPKITRKLVKIAEKRSRSKGAKIVISAFAGAHTEKLLREFEIRRVPAYPTIWRAIRAMKALSERGLHLKRTE